MDPRGRALVPLGLVRESAERLGYLVISSYNSASDTDHALRLLGREAEAGGLSCGG